MKIDIKKRLKNKTFLVSGGMLIISFVYGLLKLFEIIPEAPESEMVSLLEMGLNVLAFFGVINDPTTKGFWDSEKNLNDNTEEKESENSR